ncbi:hypothetical protein FA95DRAFT_1576452 [Auriscalpium vulgare]|uniref:Uncharacterized protein n=1 Tax=Auriscalpium vulgare TaxID=40419 RepID=A0ACB8RBQ2_9AGAM|nr:hypothetical protein FA95DRAFT_1576452 [Auriscalpium vulgare]
MAILSHEIPSHAPTVTVEAKPNHILHDVTALPSPQWAQQPWHYIFRVRPSILLAILIHALKLAPARRFQKGDSAWARSIKGCWRLVTICDDGAVEIIDSRRHTVYTATWLREGFTLRGSFSPESGDIKPDTNVVRGLIEEEGRAKVDEDAWAGITGDKDC